VSLNNKLHKGQCLWLFIMWICELQQLRTTGKRAAVNECSHLRDDVVHLFWLKSTPTTLNHYPYTSLEVSNDTCVKSHFLDCESSHNLSHIPIKLIHHVQYTVFKKTLSNFNCILIPNYIANIIISDPNSAVFGGCAAPGGNIMKQKWSR
jgi:hypothetical protein